MTTRQRTPRGEGVDRVQVAFRVDPTTKVTLNRLADALGLSQSQVVEQLLDQVTVDEQGRVYVGRKRLHAPAENQETLPLTG